MATRVTVPRVNLLCRGMLLAIASMSVTGCLSSRSLHSAHTLERGKVELAAATSATITGVFPEDTSRTGFPIQPSTSSRFIGLLPSADLGIRYGLADDVELHGMLGLSGATFGAKLQLYRGDRLALAFNPTVSGALLVIPGGDVIGGFLMWGAQAPLLCGVRFGGGHEVVLAPIIGVQSYVPGWLTIFSGAALGVSLQVTEHVRVMPELSLAAPLTQSRSILGGYVAPQPQASLAISWIP